MEIAAQTRLGWYDFAELSPARLYEVLSFRQAVFVVEQRCAYPDLDGLDQRAHHLLLPLDAALAGYLRLIPCREDRRIAIGRVAVAGASRGRGLARLMMETAIDRCRADYAGYAISLGAQAHLVPFYESFGFRGVSSAYLDYGIPHVDMEMPRSRKP